MGYLRHGLIAIGLSALIPGCVLAGASGAVAAQAGARSAAGTISTIAGGVGGPARATTVSITGCGVSFHGGSMYIADGPVVRKVDPGDGLTTPAGDGPSFGPPGYGGPATGATFNTCGVAVDNAGNLVIAVQHFRIAVVAAKTGTFYGQAMTAGHIYSVAGTGKPGNSGSGVVATKATLFGPTDVAVDGHGNLVIADSGRHAQPALLRVVAAHSGTFYGQAMRAGRIYTVAGQLTRAGSTGDGHPAVTADLGGFVGAVRVDRAGNLVLADADKERIRVVAVKTGTFYGQAMKAGDIYTVAGDGNYGFSGDGGPATAAELGQPQSVALDAAGNVVIADRDNVRVRVVAESAGTFYGLSMKAGRIYTVAGNGGIGFFGDGGPAVGARLNNPVAVAVDSATGVLAIGDSGNDRVRVVPTRSGTFYGRALKAGHIYTVAGNGKRFYSGDGGPATRAEFSIPDGLAVDRQGNLLVADNGNSTVRVLAAATGTFYGQTMEAGDAYTVAGKGNFGFSPNGTPAIDARLAEPGGVAVDGVGNLVIADTFNNRVRVVPTSSGTFYGRPMTGGDIYTVAGINALGFSGDGGRATKTRLYWPQDATVDGAGNLVIADTNNHRVRVVAESAGTFYGQAMKAGHIYTVAGNGMAGFSGDGGPATSAKLGSPYAVTVDDEGNLVLAAFNSRIRVVAVKTGTFYGQAMQAGDIYTVAGNGANGFSGDGGPATSARLHAPNGVAVDPDGNLLIADSVNNRVRVVAATSATFYGIAMTAGDIYTVAGNGASGFSGDGGPATGARVFFPSGVVPDAGNLVISDGSGRVRMVAG